MGSEDYQSKHQQHWSTRGVELGEIQRGGRDGDGLSLDRLLAVFRFRCSDADVSIGIDERRTHICAAADLTVCDKFYFCSGSV